MSCFEGLGALAPTLGTLTRLRHLDLSGTILYEGDDLPHGEPPMFAWCSLDVGPNFLSFDVVRWFLGQSHGSLRKLAIRSDNSNGLVQYISANFAGLVEIQIRLEDIVSDDDHVDAILQLAALPKLEMLCVLGAPDRNGCEQWGVRIECTTPTPKVAVFPPSAELRQQIANVLASRRR